MEQYLDLLKAIKEKGTYKPAARAGMPGTQSLFGYQLRHDLSKGFPLLTTKKMFWKGVVVELLWFLKGDTNIKYLVDNGVGIWNEDAYNYYLKTHKRIIDGLPINDPFVLLCKKPISFEEFIDYIKNNKFEELSTFEKFTNYHYGDCGYQYGKVWRNWSALNTQLDPKENGDSYWVTIDQIKNLITSLTKNPESRRHIVTAWDPIHDQDLALTWCHAMFQMNCRPLSDKERVDLYNKKINLTESSLQTLPPLRDTLDLHNIPKYYLDCQLYQRSADVFLGVPFNIASYALLTEILAKICNMIPGEFIHAFGDVHIYDNHKEAVEEQLKRTPTELPELLFSEFLTDHITPATNDLDASLKLLSLNDFQLNNYSPQASIKAELSTGLVK